MEIHETVKIKFKDKTHENGLLICRKFVLSLKKIFTFEEITERDTLGKAIVMLISHMWSTIPQHCKPALSVSYCLFRLVCDFFILLRRDTNKFTEYVRTYKKHLCTAGGQ